MFVLSCNIVSKLTFYFRICDEACKTNIANALCSYGKVEVHCENVIGLKYMTSVLVWEFFLYCKCMLWVMPIVLFWMMPNISVLLWNAVISIKYSIPEPYIMKLGLHENYLAYKTHKTFWLCNVNILKATVWQLAVIMWSHLATGHGKLATTDSWLLQASRARIRNTTNNNRHQKHHISS